MIGAVADQQILVTAIYCNEEWMVEVARSIAKRSEFVHKVPVLIENLNAMIVL